MSFRLFIYYCAIWGAWAGLLGWALGRILVPGGASPFARETLRGLYFGLMAALALGLVDGAWSLGLRRIGRILVRLLAGLFVGGIGGLLGGMLGYLFQGWMGAAGFILGWTFAGVFVGLSIGIYEGITGFISRNETGNAKRKFFRCMIGGALGGIVGGIFAVLFRGLSAALLSGKDEAWLWTPGAFTFVFLGAGIGLAVAWAQVLFKRAWVLLEEGTAPGRQWLISRENTILGQDGDLGLLDDPAVEQAHANIVHVGDQFFIEDRNTLGGTFVNDQQVRGRWPLRGGDLIRVGRNVMRFCENPKRSP